MPQPRHGACGGAYEREGVCPSRAGLRCRMVFPRELFGLEGLLMALGLIILPFIILLVLVKLLSPWSETEAPGTAPTGMGAS